MVKDEPRVRVQLLGICVEELPVSVGHGVDVVFEPPGLVRRRVEHDPGHVAEAAGPQVVGEVQVGGQRLAVRVNLRLRGLHHDQLLVEAPQTAVLVDPLFQLIASRAVVVDYHHDGVPGHARLTSGLLKVHKTNSVVPSPVHFATSFNGAK